MAELKELCIGGECMDNTEYSAGTNIDISSAGRISVKSSPTFTGTPTSPTNGTPDASTNQIATTAFVQNAIARRLPRTMFAVNESNQVIPNASGQDKVTWTAPSAGTIVAFAYVAWSANATGRRWLGAKHAAGSTETQFSNVALGACPTGQTAEEISVIRHVNSGDRIIIRVEQTSGAALTATSIQLQGLFIAD